MPWKETTTMDQKVEFICEWRTGKYTITELCKNFGISRPTAYRVIDRFEKQGYEGLREQSRTPRKHPNETSQEVIEKILKLKDRHKRWGAKKIRILLFNDFTEADIPSVVTVHNILKKNGLVCPQKRLRRVKPTYPIFDPKECNEVWSADYKGKFLMGNKKYCHPLTIADSKSRFLFMQKGIITRTFLQLRPLLQRFLENMDYLNKYTRIMDHRLALFVQYNDLQSFLIGLSN
jgi:transposase